LAATSRQSPGSTAQSCSPPDTVVMRRCKKNAVVNAPDASDWVNTVFAVSQSSDVVAPAWHMTTTIVTSGVNPSPRARTRCPSTSPVVELTRSRGTASAGAATISTVSMATATAGAVRAANRRLPRDVVLFVSWLGGR
jgi:hypothetical protein